MESVKTVDTNNNHPHYIWAFVAVLTLGMVAWVYSSNRANSETYASGSTHPESTDNNYGLVVLRPGCVNTKAEQFKKEKKNADPKVISNTTVRNP